MNHAKIITDTTRGLIPTLNQYGLMTTIFDSYTKDFIHFATTKNHTTHVAELGAAYGAVTKQLLKYNTRVTINDLDSRHINIFLEKINSIDKKKINTCIGRIPNEINFPPNTFDAILAARVLQYLMPREFISALKKIKQWLKPEGKLFIITKTPYIKILDKFIPTYITRKMQGKRWPGIVKNLPSYNKDPHISNIIPKYIHVFDPDILSRSCDEVGLQIEKVSFINRKDFPDDIKLNGQEEVGLVAVKR